MQANTSHAIAFDQAPFATAQESESDYHPLQSPRLTLAVSTSVTEDDRTSTLEGRRRRKERRRAR